MFCEVKIKFRDMRLIDKATQFQRLIEKAIGGLVIAFAFELKIVLCVYRRFQR